MPALTIAELAAVTGGAVATDPEPERAPVSYPRELEPADPSIVDRATATCDLFNGIFSRHAAHPNVSLTRQLSTACSVSGCDACERSSSCRRYEGCTSPHA